MTRKHIQELAGCIGACAANFLPDHKYTKYEAVIHIESLAHRISIILHDMDSKFNRDRFLTECGFPPQEDD